LALTQSGALYAWGYNPRGPIHPTNNSMGERLQAPTRLRMPTKDGAPPTLLPVAAGDNHGVALDTLGRVGPGGANTSNQPGRACGGTCAADTLSFDTSARILSVAAGGDRGAALDQNSHLYVWGAGQAPRLLTHADGTPARATHYSLSASEGLAVTHEGRLVHF